MTGNERPLTDVRREVVDYLRSELLGPRYGEREVLPEEPYHRYSAGILYPRDASSDPVVSEDQADDTGLVEADEEASQGDDPVQLANQYLPASMGLSFYLRGSNPALDVTIRAARYEKVTGENDDAEGWERRPMFEPGAGKALVLAPEPGRNQANLIVLEGRARLHGIWRKGVDGWLVTVSLINARKGGGEHRPPVDDCLFQPELECRPTGESVITVYPRGRLLTDDREEHILELLYREDAAYATGHGTSAGWEKGRNGKTDAVWTELIPEKEVASISYNRPAGETTAYDAQVLNPFWLAGGEKHPDLLVSR